VLSRGKVMERDAQRYALRVVGTYADISRRKDVERMKNEFIATVNHELRTPLTSIIGSLGLLRKGALGQMPTSAQRFLDMAHQSGKRLSLLVNNMLDLEKLESGNMEFRIEPVALAPLLADALSANATAVQKTGVRLELAPLSGPLSVLADRERMLQVLGNLLSNAAKFAPPDSTVTLAAQAGDGYVRISVTDRGPGVPPEFAEHMFSKFAQADGSSTRETGGPGLGLAISKAIVEKMNGEIGHISGPESGATFYVDLPPAAAH
jgi:signal transduction histidine kinase